MIATSHSDYDPKKGNYYVASELLKLGAKVDIKDKQGKTAIDIATENGNTQMLKLLTRGNVSPTTTAPSKSP
jgi:ankyrin repeat protein